MTPYTSTPDPVPPLHQPLPQSIDAGLSHASWSPCLRVQCPCQVKCSAPQAVLTTRGARDYHHQHFRPSHGYRRLLDKDDAWLLPGPPSLPAMVQLRVRRPCSRSKPRCPMISRSASAIEPYFTVSCLLDTGNVGVRNDVAPLTPHGHS